MAIFPEQKINELKLYPISYRLQQLRYWSNLSQRAFARAIECTQTSVSYWEQGKKIPNGRVLVRIIEFYQLPDDFFLDVEIQRIKLLKQRNEEKSGHNS